MEQVNNGSWLPQGEAESLHDELYYQSALHAYIAMLPAMNVLCMRDGSEAAFGRGYNILPIWKDRIDTCTRAPTPNSDVVYSMSYFDLNETGPLVVAAPPNVIGVLTDFFQRTITDVGLIGPDRARGGQYLLLPPSYEGEIPQGYFAFRSKTYNVFLFIRIVMTKDGSGSDLEPAVSLTGRMRIHPLWAMQKHFKPMRFPNCSGKRVNMMYPVDNAYWTKLKAFVDHEPVSAMDPKLQAVLASIGIVKGQPFNPNTKQQELLKQAVETAPKMILASGRLGRRGDRTPDYEARQYENVRTGGTATWLRDKNGNPERPGSHFQFAYSAASAIVIGTLGAGSKYVFTADDLRGEFLCGSPAYTIPLLPSPPAVLFWESMPDRGGV